MSEDPELMYQGTIGLQILGCDTLSPFVPYLDSIQVNNRNRNGLIFNLISAALDEDIVLLMHFEGNQPN